MEDDKNGQNIIDFDSIHGTLPGERMFGKDCGPSNARARGILKGVHHV